MQQPFKKLGKTGLISLITFLGFLISVIYHFLMRDRGYPFDTFLFWSGDRFNDFFNTLANGNSPYIKGITGSYFPLGHRINTIFNLFSPEVGLVVFLIGFAAVFCWIIYKNVPVEDKPIKYIYVMILSFLSYPFLFVLDRGNMEALVFLAIYGFIWWYNRNPLLSNLCLVVAIGMKVFPAIFFILMLSDKKYKEIIETVIMVIGFTVISLLTFNGGFMEKIYALMGLLDRYNEIYIYNLEGLFFGHSLWGIISTFGVGRIDFHTATQWYMAFVVIFFSGLCYYMVFKEKQFWKKVTLLVLSMNMLPYVSADYKLLHIFIPLLLFINNSVPDKLDKLYAVLFGLLLIPKAYYHFPHILTTLGPEASSSIIINPLIMLAFTIIIVVQGVRKNEPILLDGKKNTDYGAHGV